MVFHLPTVRVAADDQRDRFALLFCQSDLFFGNRVNTLLDIPSHIVRVGALNRRLHEFNMRMATAVLTLYGFKVAIWFFDPPVEFLAVRAQPITSFTASTMTSGHPHAERQLEYFIVAARIASTDVIQACAAELAIERLIVVTRYNDGTLLSQQVDDCSFHFIEVLEFVDQDELISRDKRRIRDKAPTGPINAVVEINRVE